MPLNTERRPADRGCAANRSGSASQLVAEQLRLRFPEEFKTGRFRRKRAELLIRCTTNMRRSFDKLTIYAVQTPISRTIPKKSEKVVDSMGQYRHNNFCCFDVRRYLSWIEGLTTNQYVGGSNPSRRTISALSFRNDWQLHVRFFYWSSERDFVEGSKIETSQ